MNSILSQSASDATLPPEKEWWLMIALCGLLASFLASGCTSIHETMRGTSRRTSIDHDTATLTSMMKHGDEHAIEVDAGPPVAPEDSSPDTDQRPNTATVNKPEHRTSIVDRFRPESTPAPVGHDAPPSVIENDVMVEPIFTNYIEEGQLLDVTDDSVGPDNDSSGPGGPGGPGDGPPGGMGGPGSEPGYSFTWYPSTSVTGQGTELGIFRQSVGLDVPVWFHGEDMVMASVSVKESHFSGEALLPDTLREFPSDLWDVQFGLKHMRQYSNGWTSMLNVDIGSATDKPFQAWRDISVQIGGFVMIPAKNERDMWMLGAIYSPLGSPPFPIPLLSYHWRPSEELEMSIGLPCNMKWQATERLSFDLSYFPILTVDALATYKFTDSLNAYGGYQNINESWFLHDRADRQDQFRTIEQRLIVGIRRDLTENLSFDVNAGYAFNRNFGVSDGMGGTPSDLKDRVKLDAGAFLSGRLTWNF